MMTARKRWLVVVLFAAAMAWVESAVVFYLRTMIDRLVPYQANPLPISGYGMGTAELIREVATLVMLFTVGWLAGRTWRGRLGYMVLAFGAWDILYYVYLIPLTRWPTSLLDWDILFLLPLPWWGPVLAPVSIATLMVLGGTLLSQFEAGTPPVWPRLGSALAGVVGAGLALYVFMADALRVAAGGRAVLAQVLPVWFNWPLFLVGLVLMAAPVLDTGWQALGQVRWAAVAAQPMVNEQKERAA